MSEPTPSPKFLDALRNLAGSLAAMLHTRLELASVELAEERHRLMKTALLACIGLVFFAMALFMLTAFIAVLFWDTYRLAAIGGLLVLYLLLSAGCLLFARRVLKLAPPLFEATLAEIDKDREALRR